MAGSSGRNTACPLRRERPLQFRHPRRHRRPDHSGMPVYADPIDGLAVPVDLLQAWTARLVESLGTPADIAADVAEILVASDRRGIASHGTARLPSYVALIEAGVMDPAARPSEDAGRPALRRFDGRNGWGHHASRVAVDAAIASAGDLGTATSIVHNSNHYGIAGWYARRGELLPVGWAIDAEGRPATTPEAALAGALHPLGGEEGTGGHKGYGLALAVDILTGVLG